MNICEMASGTAITAHDVLFFLGNKKSSIDTLRSEFPKLNWARLKQTHGDNIVHSSINALEVPAEADAHWTSDRDLALCVNTADCVPILIFCPTTNIISGIHAGWRGVANRIFPKLLKQLEEKGSEISNLAIVIGPHIKTDSFEVDLGVKNQLLESCATTQDLEPLYFNRGEKFHMDLQKILLCQLGEFARPPQPLFISDVDTVKNLGYHSFRRDREHSGRQISFIAKIS